jgi:hypothetical protein
MTKNPSIMGYLWLAGLAAAEIPRAGPVQFRVAAVEMAQVEPGQRG